MNKPSFDKCLLYFTISLVIITVLAWFLDPRPTAVKMLSIQIAADAEQGVIGIIMLPTVILAVIIVGLILVWKSPPPSE